DAPFDDAGPLLNPFVGGIHQPLELVVVHHAGRQIFAPAGDPHRRPGHDAACPSSRRAVSSTVMIVSPACTSWPVSATMAATHPVRSARISLKIFIVSINPTTVSGSTRSPTSTYGGTCGDGDR